MCTRPSSTLFVLASDCQESTQLLLLLSAEFFQGHHCGKHELPLPHRATFTRTHTGQQLLFWHPKIRRRLLLIFSAEFDMSRFAVKTCHMNSQTSAPTGAALLGFCISRGSIWQHISYLACVSLISCSHFLSSQTGLLVACYQGYVDVVIALSQCPYLDANWQDSEGNTALITAAQAGQWHKRPTPFTKCLQLLGNKGL